MARKRSLVGGITLPMYCNINAVRKTVKDGKVIMKPREYGEPYWPDHIKKLAEAIKQGDNCYFALHDALLDLGLPLNSSHFVEGHCVLNGVQYGCSHALIIAKGGNPDWGSSWWCLDPKDEIRLLEEQEELEKWWGFKPKKKGSKFLKEWCKQKNAATQNSQS